MNESAELSGIFVGDIGTRLQVTATLNGVAVDISSANTTDKRKFYVTKPDEDATEVIWTPSFLNGGTDGVVYYDTVSGDLDSAGLWELQLWVELTSRSGFLASLSFEVKTPTSSVDNGIIASWGGATDNCYVTLGYANGYILKSIVNHDSWTNATVQQRVSALLQATRDIDSLNFFGNRYFGTQFLEWPRSSNQPWPWNLVAYNQAVNLSVEQVRMKDSVKKACCHQALWILDNQDALVHAKNQAMGVESYYQKLGPLEDEYHYGKSSLPPTVSPVARKLLSEWITGRKIARA